MATARTPIGTAGVPPDAIARILRPRGLAGWNVRKDQLIALDDSGTVTVPSHWSVVRDDPTTGAVKPLGVVGNRNEPIQNEQHLELVIEIAETPDLDILDAGFVHDGRLVFIACRLENDVVINPRELTPTPIAGPFELVTFNHHDGSGALWFGVMPAGTWQSAILPLFAPDAVRPPSTQFVKRYALTRARLRHDASRRRIAGKLHHDLGLDHAGGGPLPLS